MAKVSGSYESIMRGVSQQIPEQRLNGQHSEQVNMLSDPVAGLARRRGSDNIAEHAIINGATAADKADLRQFVMRDFKQDVNDFCLLYRTQPRVAGSNAPALMCYNKRQGGYIGFVTAGAALDMVNRGVSSITQVGRFMLMSSLGYTNTATATELWGAAPNTTHAAVWIRAGAFNRTYSITFSKDNINRVVSYTTPSSTYSGVLNTSDIPATATDYQKQVNDRVNAHNGEVTAWIGTSSAASQPFAIAAGLVSALQGGGFGGSFQVVGSTVVMTIPGLQGLQASDGGDSSLIRSVWQTVPEAAGVTSVHVANKIVKVQAKAGAPAYYLKAVPKVLATLGWTEVTWEEAAGSEVAFGPSMLISTVDNGALYIATTPAELRSLIPGLNIPDFSNRVVGDVDSNKAPYFFNRKIDYLGTFQDRLVVGSGGVISMSEVGNYFNFFRTSVLTVIDSDPVEVYALGSEDDTIRRSVIFDKSLLLFGDEQQYVINGRVPVTPATTTVVQSSAHEGTTGCKPIASGDFVFYFKQREGVTQAYQLSIGQVVEDTSNATEITQQLDAYIGGAPLEAVSFTSPDMLLLRTSSSFSTVYTYRYLDQKQGQQRLLDSWSKWEYSPLLGDLIGMSVYEGAVFLYWARVGVGADGVLRTWIAIDRQSLLPSIGSAPYLDSSRLTSAVGGGLASRLWHNQAGLSSAYDRASGFYLHGEAVIGNVAGMIAELPGASFTGLHTGTEFASYVEPTNPYKRSQEGIAKTEGRLTVTSLTASYKDTAAIKADVITKFGVQAVLDFRGRIMGADNNIIGVQPVSRGSVPMFIGRETREYRLQIKAVSWFPMTLTSFEWTGQAFFNAQRA